jgi:multimeric flavodoxin WrbA
MSADRGSARGLRGVEGVEGTVAEGPADAPRVVGLMGSYHPDGVTARALEAVLAGARAAGARTERIDLAAREIEFCRNCRACTQTPGPERGECVLHDDLDDVLSTLESADGLVLAAPVNFGDVNALTRRFLERMVGCGYWPFGQKAPAARSATRRRAAVLVTSSAAPGVLTRLFMRPLSTLRRMAALLHAQVVGTLVQGLAGDRAPRLDERHRRRAETLGRRLAERASALRATPRARR